MEFHELIISLAIWERHLLLLRKALIKLMSIKCQLLAFITFTGFIHSPAAKLTAETKFSDLLRSPNSTKTSVVLLSDKKTRANHFGRKLSIIWLSSPLKFIKIPLLFCQVF